MDLLIDRYAERAGGQRPSVSDDLLLLEFIAFDREDEPFAESMSASNASIRIVGAGDRNEIPIAAALLGEMDPGRIAGEKRRAKLKEAIGAGGVFGKQFSRPGIMDDDFDFWEDRYWAFLPRALAVVAVERGRVPSSILLPVAEDWTYASTTEPVTSESSELSYVVLRPARTNRSSAVERSVP